MCKMCPHIHWVTLVVVNEAVLKVETAVGMVPNTIQEHDSRVH